MSKRIQSVLFDKTKWEDKDSCIAYLIAHDLKHTKCHETVNHYRFRQYDPSIKEEYRTYKADQSGVQYIIPIR